MEGCKESDEAICGGFIRGLSHRLCTTSGAVCRRAQTHYHCMYVERVFSMRSVFAIIAYWLLSPLKLWRFSVTSPDGESHWNLTTAQNPHLHHKQSICTQHQPSQNRHPSIQQRPPHVLASASDPPPPLPLKTHPNPNQHVHHLPALSSKPSLSECGREGVGEKVSAAINPRSKVVMKARD